MAKAVFFFGMSRGGSSITFQIIQKLLLSCGYKHYDPEGDAYRSNSPSELSSQLGRLAEIIDVEDVLVGPFRDNRASRIQAINEIISSKGDNVACIIITRDPIDCLHSWYYAKDLHPGWSNKDVKEGCSVSEFAMQLSRSYLDELEGLIELVSSRPCMHYSYQDIVLGPTKWLRDCLSRLRISPSSESLAVVNPLMSFLNPYENPLSHRRSGLPGSARQIIDPETLLQIDKMYFDFNRAFGYPRFPLNEQDLDMSYELASLRDSLKLLMEKNGKLTQALASLQARIQPLTEQSVSLKNALEAMRHKLS